MTKTGGVALESGEQWSRDREVSVVWSPCPIRVGCKVPSFGLPTRGKVQTWLLFLPATLLAFPFFDCLPVFFAMSKRSSRSAVLEGSQPPPPIPRRDWSTPDGVNVPAPARKKLTVEEGRVLLCFTAVFDCCALLLCCLSCLPLRVYCCVFCHP